MDFSNMGVLIVDDNPVNLKVLRDSLQDLKCKVYATSSGKDALNVLSKVKPSLIILDIMMPEMDGFELYDMLKLESSLKLIPVIFITAFNDSENELKALSMGAVDYITKPIDPLLVKCRVENHLKLRFLQEELENEAYTRGKQFLALFEGSSNPMIIINFDKIRIEMVNKSAQEFFGRSQDELLSSQIVDLLPDLKEDILVQSLKGKLSAFDWSFKNKDAKEIPCEVVITEFPGDEPLVRLSIVDVSERKNKANELEIAHRYINSIMSSMPIVLIGLNEDMMVTQWNSKAIEYTGYSLNEAVGKYIIDLIPHIKLDFNLIRESIDSQIVKKRHKKSRITDRGTIFENITIYPIEESEFRGAVLLIDDISDQVELQSMVIQSERMVSIGELASGVAHEIMNPLAGIIQNSQSILKRLTSDIPGNLKALETFNIELESLKLYLEDRKILKMVKSIKESGMQASHIIKNLTNYSRKDIGNLTYNNLVPLISQSIDLAQNEYKIELGYDMKNIEVKKNVKGKIPLILCEPGKIIQAFLNLLRFSAKNIGKKSDNPKIDITVEALSSSVKVIIIDNGVAISQDEIETLIEPYFKGKSDSREDWFSLSLTYFIITEVHNGLLKISSDTKIGNIVEIEFPTNK